MDFFELNAKRQSCRAYLDQEVEEEKLQKLLDAARLAPSACNGQPYRITVCRGQAAAQVAKATQGMGMNKFAGQAPILLVLSEEDYVKSAALGAKLKGNDYRSMDIGILASIITLAATELGLSTCMLGWLDDEKIRSICGLDHPVRLVITLGYASDETVRPKKRKDDLIRFCQ